MSSDGHQEIEVLRGKLEDSQRQLSKGKEDNDKKEREIKGWRILAGTARKEIELLKKKSKECNHWKAMADGRKHELEALRLRLRREATDRERELAQTEQNLRETIERNLRETIGQDVRTAIEEEHKANYVCRQRKRKVTGKAGNGVQKAKKAPVQTLASTREKRTFPSKYKR